MLRLVFRQLPLTLAQHVHEAYQDKCIRVLIGVLAPGGGFAIVSSAKHGNLRG